MTSPSGTDALSPSGCYNLIWGHVNLGGQFRIGSPYLGSAPPSPRVPKTALRLPGTNWCSMFPDPLANSFMESVSDASVTPLLNQFKN